MAQGKFIVDLIELASLPDDGMIEVQRSEEPQQTKSIKKSAFLAELQLALDTHTHTEDQITDLDKYSQAEVNNLLATQTHVEADITDLDRTRPRGAWANGETYEINDLAHENGWVGVANAQTGDNVAPLTVGSPYNAYDSTISSNSAVHNQIIFGQRYTWPVGGYLTSYRVNMIAGNTYEIYLVEDPLGPNPILSVVMVFTAAVTGWNTFSIADVLIFAGESFDIVARVTESGRTPVSWTGDWNYTTPNNPGIPAAGVVIHANDARGILDIHREDFVGGDRHAELMALDVGDVINAAGQSWAIQSKTDNTDYVTFGISPAQQGGPDGIETFTFETFTASTITWAEDIGYWTGNANSEGLFIADGQYSDIVPNDNQYGIDIEVQKATISPDWDIYSMGASASSGGSAGLNNSPAKVYYFDTRPVPVVDVDASYPVDPDTVGPNQVQVRIKTIVPAGDYQLTISNTASMSTIANDIMTRVSVDGGATWNEGSREVSDTGDTVFGVFSLPLSFQFGLVDLICQVRKENPSGSMTCHTCSLVLDGK